MLQVGGKFIRVKVVEAKDLISMDSNGFSDPFCVVTFNEEKKNSKTTEIVYKSLNPVWNPNTNEFTFRVNSPLTDTVKLVVWDYDNKLMNDYEGQITIPVAAAAAKPNGKKTGRFGVGFVVLFCEKFMV